MDIIDAFGQYNLNKSFKRWYANVNQRKAITELMVDVGKEKMLQVISMLPKTNTLPYFPTIETPHQLLLKWNTLENAFIRKKNEHAAKRPHVVM